jgi:hypothetical protein
MDLSQVKLSKKEWASVEIPVSDSEKEILRLIEQGFQNVHIRYNSNKAMFSVLKIAPTPEMELYLYNQYFESEIQTLNKKMSLNFCLTETSKIKVPKKADMLRLNNLGVGKQRDAIFEFVLLDICATASSDAAYCAYTLHHLLKSTISNLNKYVVIFCKHMIYKIHAIETMIPTMVRHSYKIIEKNPNLLKYEDRCLYDHQKQLFQLFRTSGSKLVLYTAPTGTGKTLSPLGLSCGYRIIYICAARHVGLALAKSAISMEKCVAFAFGCETASDIRLHYYAAAEYTKNRKSGGIFKVDNSNGSKVEIMICDVSSYLVAMYYMLSFNPEENIVLYWDEPTISLDVETNQHPLHEKIHKLWQENKISKVVLSCATLPKEAEILDTLSDFRATFESAEVHFITSYDCKKTINVLDQTGQSVLPHLLFDKYEDIQKCVEHCLGNRVLLRYFSLREILRFVDYVESGNFIPKQYTVDMYFGEIDNVDLYSIKIYYLELLKHVDPTKWNEIHLYMKNTAHISYTPFTKTHSLDVVTDAAKSSKQSSTLRRMASMQVVRPASTPILTHAPDTCSSSATSLIRSTMSSGILLTTEDAHTLTDGPTIFLAEDTEKLGKFYIQQSKIPKQVFDHMMEKIGLNNQIQKRMEVLMKALDDAIGSDIDKDKKVEKEAFKPEVRKIMNSIEALRGEISVLTMEPVYVPNTRQHQQVWVKDGNLKENAFVPYVDDTTVREIMELDIDTQMKLLLMLGIGVFVSNMNQDTPSKVAYVEIMKRLSQEQKLYLIIASSDYIYGTNYQLCHAFLGKDLLNMTQQKIIQAMGRVGRRQIQQEYTVRFRDNKLLYKLFLPNEEECNLEAKNMCALLVHDLS